MTIVKNFSNFLNYLKNFLSLYEWEIKMPYKYILHSSKDSKIFTSSSIDHLMRSCNLDLHQINLIHIKMLEHWLDDHHAPSSTFLLHDFSLLSCLQPCLNSSILLDMSLIQPSLCQVLQVIVSSLLGLISYKTS